MVNRRFVLFCLVLLLAAGGFLGVILYGRYQAHLEYQVQARLAREDAARIRANAVLYVESRVNSGSTFADSLRRLGLDPALAAGISTAASSVFNLRQFRAGHVVSIGRTVEGQLRSVRYEVDTDRMLWVTPRDSGYAAELRDIPTKLETVGIHGEVRDSLFNAVLDAGESPELAMRLAEIFGWDLDFYTDTRQGDTFRVVLEKKSYLNGKTVGYGRILAAEYNNDGRPFRAVLFHDPAGLPAYYAPDGSSLQKAFLRSPLKFAAPITSHFTHDRFHPILKIHRPHLGIDYAAPTGTPVQSIGNGRVVSAGRQGGAGNLVHIRHSNGYETMYMHLSRILVRTGQTVEQGQRIGLVGMTGLATGPHLDFRILQNGQYRNFETLHLPPAEPVARKFWGDFVAARDQVMPLLQNTGAVQAQGGQTAGAAAAGVAAAQPALSVAPPTR